MPPTPKASRNRARAADVGNAGSPEQSVRDYLNFLADPDGSTDPKRIAALEASIEVATDHIERLRLLAALEEARRPNGERLLANFVRDAKEWAEAESIPASAFTQLGVSDAVLRQAGILKAGRGPAHRRSSDRTTRRVSVEDIKAWALDQPDTITIKDVTTALGGSLVTANKALQALVAEGSLSNIGPSADHRGPGRAPARFMVAKKRKAKA